MRIYLAIVAFLLLALAFGPGCGGGGTSTGTGGGDVPGVAGRILNGQGTAPEDAVAGLQVDVFDASNNLVATATSGADGRFSTVVPLTAATFEIHKASIPSNYYKEYKWGSKWYLPEGACRATLPAISTTHTTQLGDIIVEPTSFQGSSVPPPPPPSACGG